MYPSRNVITYHDDTGINSIYRVGLFRRLRRRLYIFNTKGEINFFFNVKRVVMEGEIIYRSRIHVVVPDWNPDAKLGIIWKSGSTHFWSKPQLATCRTAISGISDSALFISSRACHLVYLVDWHMWCFHLSFRAFRSFNIGSQHIFGYSTCYLLSNRLDWLDVASVTIWKEIFFLFFVPLFIFFSI